jgi:hypothetical protein
MPARTKFCVMAGLVPAIHDFLVSAKNVDARHADKFTQSAQARLLAGHDEGEDGAI